jgi:DNA-binding NtrC family response regulator
MPSTTTTRRNDHILVVEPDPLFRLLLCVAMASEFSDFHAVATINEARALLAEHDFPPIIAENDFKGGNALSIFREAL